MKYCQKYWSRLKNPAVVLAIAGYAVTMIADMGISIDNQAVMGVVNAVCSVLILLGIMNNPVTAGIDLPARDSGDTSTETSSENSKTE